MNFLDNMFASSAKLARHACLLASEQNYPQSLEDKPDHLQLQQLLIPDLESFSAWWTSSIVPAWSLDNACILPAIG